MEKRPQAVMMLSTHFNLASLKNLLSEKTKLFNLKVIVRENEPPLFTYKLEVGHARDSLAFVVARMAGVSSSLIDDAKEIKKMYD